MIGAIIYFSGTGNTEYCARRFKEEFLKHNIECSLIDICKNKKINDTYDFYVFGAPIHAESFPIVFDNWIKNNFSQGNKRKCIVFSTQASDSAAGNEIFSKWLEKKKFIVPISVNIKMPNNYYLIGFSATDENIIKVLKENSADRIKTLVNKFLNREEECNKVSVFRKTVGSVVYKMFYLYSLKWPKRNIEVDKNICVKCAKCVKDCPVSNIILENDLIKFKNKCISCQRCLHSCPKNAFMYKGKHFKQFKL